MLCLREFKRLACTCTSTSHGVTTVKYLGLIITPEGLQMDPEKVQTILGWAVPTTVKDIQSFLGFANFYRRLIAASPPVIKSLLEVVREGTKTTQSLPLRGTALKAFKLLKTRFTSAPVLRHFNPDLPAWIETDASDYVVAVVLSQEHDGVLYPVAFLSQKMSPAECNYEIYDKELLAIVRAFEEWRPELAGVAEPVKVLSDHQALQYFMTDKRLTRRQARWAQFLSEFNFKVTYRPGRLGTKPDALTRRPGDIPEGVDDERKQHQVQTVLKSHNVEDSMVRTFSNTDSTGATAAHFARIALQEYDTPVAQLAVLAQGQQEVDMTCAASRCLFRTRASATYLLAALEDTTPEPQESQSDPVGDGGLGVRREASQNEPPHSSRDVPEKSHGLGTTRTCWS